MQPEDAVNMDIPMTEEEWAIWQALWRVPDPAAIMAWIMPAA